MLSFRTRERLIDGRFSPAATVAEGHVAFTGASRVPKVRVTVASQGRRQRFSATNTGEGFSLTEQITDPVLLKAVEQVWSVGFDRLPFRFQGDDLDLTFEAV